MLKAEMKESVTGVVLIQDVEEKTMEKLLDLKSSDVGNSINFSQIGSLQDEIPDDIKNANIISDNNDNANLNN